MSGVHRLCDQELVHGPARGEIKDRVWQEPQVCPWLPGCRQRKSSSLSLWVPHPTVTGPRSPRAALCPLGAQLSDLTPWVFSWASLWRCQVPTPVFPAWRPSPAPWGYLSPWPKPKALPLARSAPAVWVPSRSPGGAQEPREFREVGRDSQILSAAGRGMLPRHLTPGLWPASGQAHRRGLLPHHAGPVGDLGMSSTSLDSLPEAMTYRRASPRPPPPITALSMENAQFASWVPFCLSFPGVTPTLFAYSNKPWPSRVGHSQPGGKDGTGCGICLGHLTAPSALRV